MRCSEPGHRALVAIVAPRGPGREHFGEVVRLAPDVAQVFPDAASVNEALRFLIRIAKERERAIPKPKSAA